MTTKEPAQKRPAAKRPVAADRAPSSQAHSSRVIAHSSRRRSPTWQQKRDAYDRQANQEPDERRVAGVVRESSLANKDGLEGHALGAKRLLEADGFDCSTFPDTIPADSGVHLIGDGQVDMVYAIESAGESTIGEDGLPTEGSFADALVRLLDEGDYQAIYVDAFDRLIRAGMVGEHVRLALLRNHTTVRHQSGVIDLSTPEGEAAWDREVQASKAYVAAMKRGMERGRETVALQGYWPFSHAPPLGVRLTLDTIGRRPRWRPEWDEEILQSRVAPVLEAIAAGQRPRKVAAKHLIGLATPGRERNRRKNPHRPVAITEVGAYTDQLIRNMCTRYADLYLTGVYTIYEQTVRGSIRKVEVNLGPPPQGALPQPGIIKAAQAQTERRRLQPMPDGRGRLLSGLVRHRSPDGSSRVLAVSNNGRTVRKGVPMYSNGSGEDRVSYAAKDLEKAVLEQLSALLVQLRDRARIKPNRIRTHSGRIAGLRNELQRQENTIRRTVEVIATSTDDVTLQHATKLRTEAEHERQRINQQIEELSSDSPTARSTKPPNASELEALLRDDTLDLSARQRVVRCCLPYGITIDHTGNWTGDVVVTVDRTTITHPISGRAANRSKYVPVRGVLKLWLSGHRIPDIISGAADGTARAEAFVRKQGLAPHIGQLAYTDSPTIQDVARGLILGDTQLTRAHGRRWERAVKRAHFQTQRDGEVVISPLRGTRYTTLAKVSKLRQQILQHLADSGGSATLEELDEVVESQKWNIDATLHRWVANPHSIITYKNHVAALKRCTRCGTAEPAQVARVEVAGAVCTHCRRDEGGLYIDETLDAHHVSGWPLQPPGRPSHRG